MSGYPKPSELLSKTLFLYWWINCPSNALNALKSGLKCKIEGI